MKKYFLAVVGDWESIGLLDHAKNPHWKCTICRPDATSTDLLAALPTVIALHPDAIHILTGELEVDSGGLGYLGVVPTNNIVAMVTKIRAAKIPIVIGLLPPVKVSPDSDNYRLNIGLIFDYTDVYGSPGITLLPVIDYADIDVVFDVDPDSAVYAAMLPLTEAAIDDLAVSSKVTGKVYGLPADGLRQ